MFHHHWRTHRRSSRTGDLLTFFIFWEAATQAQLFLMLYRKNAFSLNATMKYLIMVIIAFRLRTLSVYPYAFGVTAPSTYLALSGAYNHRRSLRPSPPNHRLYIHRRRLRN
jgi:NADH:ubiquinone oxidoreductase subunit 2 (subunit N)